MAAIFGERKFLWKCKEYFAKMACGLKIPTKSLYLAP